MLSSASELELRPLSRFFRALSDETRLRIVALLTHGELCVCHIEHALALPQPTASRQLGLLRAAGIVDCRRDGSWVYYRLSAQDHELVRRLLDELTATFASRRVLRDDLARVRRQSGPGACGK